MWCFEQAGHLCEYSFISFGSREETKMRIEKIAVGTSFLTSKVAPAANYK
tara:strand:+ start:1463 stop:1612 length:150 start_codon:yes stop_codon:yes gene_type:complete